MRSGTSIHCYNMPSNNMPPSANCGQWKAAYDQKRGRPYYYHTVTKEVRWEKPADDNGNSKDGAVASSESSQMAFASPKVPPRVDVAPSSTSNRGSSLKQRRTPRQTQQPHVCQTTFSPRCNVKRNNRVFTSVFKKKSTSNYRKSA